MPIKTYRRKDHPYYNYHHRRYIPKKNRTLIWWSTTIFTVVLILSAYTYYLYARPVGSIEIHRTSTAIKTSDLAINWPVNSDAALGSLEQGIVAEKNPQATPRPTASVAKLITVLTILKEKPLELGEQGPVLTMTANDKTLYENYYRQNGSVVQVNPEQKLTQYQMLQGILLPSANNLADSLAIWAFGSLESYQVAAQKLVNSLGMKDTTVGVDASGFSPTTTSTAKDLTLLGIAALKEPVIAEIVSQDEVNLPMSGVRQSTNWLLGTDGVIGIKTGNTDEAGGVFIFAANYQAGMDSSTLIVGAVQGEPTINEAIHVSHQLLLSTRSNFKVVKPIRKGQVIASYQAPWGEKVFAVAKSDIKITSWSAKPIIPQVQLDKIHSPVARGSTVGLVKVGNHSSQIVLDHGISRPSWQWRVLGRK